MIRLNFIVALAAVLLLPDLGRAQKQVPFLSPAESLKTIQLPPGYFLEPVVTDPVIKEPAVAVFDGNGVMYVAEMRTYMQDADGSGKYNKVSRVSRHVDTDGDGKIDKSTVFIDKLLLPRILLPLDDRLVVGETNTLDLYVYRDTNGDGVADEKKLFYQGGRRGGNLEHQPSGLIWSLDNWLYTTYNRYRLRYTGSQVLKEPTAGNGGQWGLTQDVYGKPWYVNAGGERGPIGYQVPTVYGNLNARGQEIGDYKSVWPIDNIPDVQGGPRRIRKDNTLNHFTATCGQEIFRGDRLPKELVGNLFFGEPVGRLIRRTTITVKDGITYIANPYEEQKGEFIRSTDPNFRPINMVTAPDGTMYIVDMYRGIIQEGNWVRKGSYLRKVVEKYGLQNNIGRGRIWRLRHKDFKPGPQPKMLEEKPAQLVAHLAHPNGWWRVTAQKLLILRGDKSVGPALIKMAAADPNHLARIHAIWTLEGLGLLDASIVKKGLADRHPQVRIAAIRASESLFKAGNNDLTEALKVMAKDKDPNVVLQFLMTAQHVKLDGHQEIGRAVVSASTSRGVKELGGKFTGAGSGGGDGGGPKLSKGDRKMLAKGKEIYESLCFACHGANGKGQPLGKAPEGTKIPPNAAKTLAPSLVGSKTLMGHPDGPINVVLHGLTGPIDGKVYAGQMISMKSYDDKWVAAILSYLRNSFGNSGSMVRPEAVARVRKETAGRQEPWTIDELRKSMPQQLTNRKQWKLKASHNGGSLANAVDGKMNSRFDTGTAMKKGMWIQIDLPQTTKVSSLILDATGSDNDYPRGYAVHVSKDGRSFSKKPLVTGTGTGPKVQIDLPPTEARSVRITLTSGVRGKFWSIHEMQIYGSP